MNPVGWFEIYVKDMAKARAFYEGVFGVTLTALESPEPSVGTMWAFPMQQNGAGATGALASMQGGEQPSGNATIVYFNCADCAVETKRVPDHGGRIVRDKFPIGQYGFIALVTDPTGNVIGLHSTK